MREECPLCWWWPLAPLLLPNCWWLVSWSRYKCQQWSRQINQGMAESLWPCRVPQAPSRCAKKPRQQICSLYSQETIKLSYLTLTHSAKISTWQPGSTWCSNELEYQWRKIIFYTGIKMCTRPPLLWCYHLWKGVKTPDRITRAQLLSQLIPRRHEHFTWECMNGTALTRRLPFITFLWLDQFVQGTYVSYAILSVNKMMHRLAIIKSASLHEQHFSDTIYFSATKEQLRNIKAATSGWTLWGTPVILSTQGFSRRNQH